MNSDKATSPGQNHPTLRPTLMVCQKPAKCEPVDDIPKQYYDTDACVSSNVTLNRCVAKNGACSSSMGDAEEYGYFTGVSALWDKHHVVSIEPTCIFSQQRQISLYFLKTKL